MTIEVVLIDPDSKEAEAICAHMNAAIAESLAYLAAHGVRSAEGFFYTDRGPIGFEESD